jgi:hypothetical protein
VARSATFAALLPVGCLLISRRIRRCRLHTPSPWRLLTECGCIALSALCCSTLGFFSAVRCLLTLRPRCLPPEPCQSCNTHDMTLQSQPVWAF